MQFKLVLPVGFRDDAERPSDHGIDRSCVGNDCYTPTRVPRRNLIAEVSNSPAKFTEGFTIASLVIGTPDEKIASFSNLMNWLGAQFELSQTWLQIQGE